MLRADKICSLSYGTRSALIEQAVRDFLAVQTKRTREAQDLEILNSENCDLIEADYRRWNDVFQT
jgi:hypothetical protein